MTVKLLALDLDGTIFGDDLVISDRTRTAIREAQAQGVLVTIATGRMFRSAHQIASDLGIEAPLICYQGALVRHSVTGDTLFHKTIASHFTHVIITETTQRGLHLNVYVDDKLYVDRITDQALFYAKINMDLPINEVGDLHAWLRSRGEPEPTKLVIVTNADKTDNVLSLFTGLYGNELQVTKSHARFTEFTSREASKGKALAFLASKCGTARDEVMAIGDGHNDLDMIAWAGYGVAMSTSPEAVLKAARIVCPPLWEDGAADTIERFVIIDDGRRTIMRDT
ncbi:MAG TPA: Cof-type HAD-IIB family hydrolase [Chloroflexia bacterium]|nr:Cof-type HAD-IIB family hydrolase [Chloroflexia bacterium]